MKKATAEILTTGANESFLCRHFNKRGFDAPYHFHPEIELTLILKGRGKRFVGTGYDIFNGEELVLLGPDLPHCWKLDEVSENEDAESIVIQFKENFLGRDFFLKPEFSKISDLLYHSNKGILFSNVSCREISPSIKEIATGKNNFNNIMLLLNLLAKLAESEDYKYLTEGKMEFQKSSDQERINKVFAFIMENYHRNISLKEVSEIANMSTYSFCKYFKKITRKTLIETITGYRLDKAVKLLVKTGNPVGDIALESGFGDISHFHKIFKIKYGMSPLKYRQKFKTLLEV